MHSDETFLVLGGAGLVGEQVVRQIARHLNPRRLILASLYQQEVRQALHELEREFPRIHFVGFWGDVFVRSEFNTLDRRHKRVRRDLLASDERRAELFEDLFGSLDEAYRRSQLVQLVLEHRPGVIVDAINTATAISYQDLDSAAVMAKRAVDQTARRLEATDLGVARADAERARQAVESLLISQSVPQLVRHVLLLHRAMAEVGTRLYLKIGTTGTGGMGLNVPYTHSEDKPSAKLMTKTAIAFAHTGLMFLMARTPDGPIVKEIKPGAMIGHAGITCRAIHERGKPVYRFDSRVQPLGAELVLRQSEAEYRREDKLKLVIVDTGENGLFTKGEFETITHLRQMEYVTPEEIARAVLLEIKGSNTGLDVIGAIDAAVMNPSYRAGYLRHSTLEEMTRLEHETGTHSVALGQLGPPELGKLLWESHLLKLEYQRLSAVLEQAPQDVAGALYRRVQSDENLRHTVTSVGLPILAPDGQTLIRGPFIRIPEVRGANSVAVTPENVDAWAAKGWVDLRPANFDKWQDRFRRMLRAAQRMRGRGTAAITRDAYLSDEISIGAVVGWVFNNEEGGYRIK